MKLSSAASLVNRLLRRRPESPNVAFAESFNPPLKFIGGQWHTNERIIEVPFVHNVLQLPGDGRRVMEFGCTRSVLAIELLSWGYDVTGVDLRDYELTHPRFEFWKGDILNRQPAPLFDAITTVSVLEHVGLGAYTDQETGGSIQDVLACLRGYLKPQGILIATVPIGKPHTDRFLHSFSPTEIDSAFRTAGLIQERAAFFRKTEPLVWKGVRPAEIAEVSNAATDRPPTGVNGVGCFVLRSE